MLQKVQLPSSSVGTIHTLQLRVQTNWRKAVVPCCSLRCPRLHVSHFPRGRKLGPPKSSLLGNEPSAAKTARRKAQPGALVRRPTHSTLTPHACDASQNQRPSCRLHFSPSSTVSCTLCASACTSPLSSVFHGELSWVSTAQHRRVSTCWQPRIPIVCVRVSRACFARVTSSKT